MSLQGKRDAEWAAIREAESRKPIVVRFPLRPDFLASVSVPRDMTDMEADRLAAMIRALGLPTDTKEPER